MALSQRTVIKKIAIELDGRVAVYEVDEVYEGGFIDGTLVATSPQRGRMIDVGDDTAAEEDIVKDVVNGNLHSAERKAARDAEKAEQGGG